VPPSGITHDVRPSPRAIPLAPPGLEESMQRILLSLLVIVSAAPLPAVPVAPPEKVYDVTFDALTCAVCRKQIKETLLKIPKVKSVDYDLKCYKCYVTMEADATLTATQVEEAFRPTKYIFRTLTECKNPPKFPAPESKPATKG
jgi:copper chaperone CopZ